MGRTIDYYSEDFELSTDSYIISAGYFTQELLPYQEGVIRKVLYK